MPEQYDILVQPPGRPLGQGRVLAPGSEITPWNSHARSADFDKPRDMLCYIDSFENLRGPKVKHVRFQRFDPFRPIILRIFNTNPMVNTGTLEAKTNYG